MASQTQTIELQEVKRQEPSTPTQEPLQTDEVERWNHPKSNTIRLAATFWSFLVLGMNDGSYGALIPFLESYYDLSFTIVSLIFLSPFVGYFLAALLNNPIHLRFGQRGVAFIAPVCKLVAFVVTSLHLPYPVLVVAYLVNGFGNGLEDSAWNAWVGDLANANELLGFLHAFFGLGATIAPLIATSLVVRAGRAWWYYYYVMIGFSFVELVTSLYAFWDGTGAAFRAATQRSSSTQQGNRMREALWSLPAARVTWLCAFFLLGYVGTEVAFGGWIVTFMIRVRDGTKFASGITATGFWLGMTIGRVVLGFVTPRVGERLAVTIYLPLSMGLILAFWLIPSFTASAIFAGFLGFFLGPLFPAAVVASTKLLPKHLHVGAIGFAAAFGGGGAAIFPFAVGALAQEHGVWVLQPFALGLLVWIWLLWLALPRISKKRD